MNNGNTFTVLIFRLIGGFLRGENENRARPEHLEQTETIQHSASH